MDRISAAERRRIAAAAGLRSAPLCRWLREITLVAGMPSGVR